MGVDTEVHSGMEGEGMSTEATSMSTDSETSSSDESLVVVEPRKETPTLSLSTTHRLYTTLPVGPSKVVHSQPLEKLSFLSPQAPHPLPLLPRLQRVR